MTHPFSDEFLSAWLDDELNDSESAEIQATIDNDPDLARQVHELRLLSGIFKSLPVEPVPRGFKDLVVEATRKVVRDTSPASRSATVHQTKANPTRPQARRWWFGVIGLVSTAALVLVTIDLTGKRDDNMERSVVSTVPADASAESTDTRAADSRDEIEPVDLAGAGLPAPSMSFGDAVLSQLTFENLKDADVGDVIQAIRQSGNEATVVKLTVVDINASVNRLEVLLAEHDGSARRTGGMVMVEANYDQLADCFRHLQQEDLYQQMLVASSNIDSPPNDDGEKRKPLVRTKDVQKKPIRLIIVLKQAPDSETNEGNGSTIKFQSVYGPIG